ncbi:4586_t:CDS:2 [Funneliformis caledonium]|uniref:4586_t:CDS:1 n=1 Tax=Funneliformis caledonium TaxID=1117310 RepID=A0A9N9FCP5_9GLOM|nr:4586_t:CDS:2 [Funneliformis caledonium]
MTGYKFIQDIYKANSSTNSKKFQDFNEQEFREKKNQVYTQQQQGLIGSSSNNYLNPNANNDKIAEIKSNKVSSNVKFGLALITLQEDLLQKSPSFIRKFADTTNNILAEINSLDIPTENTITEHTVACSRVANVIERSPAFRCHGKKMAMGLRNFGERILIASRTLQNMHNKGSSVYQSFDEEIESMMHRLNSNYIRQVDDNQYFKDKFDELRKKIKDYRQLVEQAQMSVLNAEAVRHDTEGYIYGGLREAEKYICDRNSAYSVDIDKVKQEFVMVENILQHLYVTAVNLDKMRKFLEVYEDRLLDVSAGFSEIEYDKFKITKEDLKYLRLGVEKSKAYHYKYSKRQIST